MDSDLVSYLADAGTAGVVVVLMITGWLVPKWEYQRAVKESARKDREIEKLQEALSLERQRSDAGTHAGEVTLQLVKGIVRLADQAREERARSGLASDKPTADPPATLELTAEDLGL
jgi:hypothetical protein